MLYVAALGNVDRSLEEAAAIDGATKLQIFWKIKWAQIMPTTLYVLVITTINSFQCFALIQLLTRGGPLGSTSTLMYYIFDMAYNYPALRLCQRHGRGPGHLHRHFLRDPVQESHRRTTVDREGSICPKQRQNPAWTANPRGYKIFVIIVLALLAVFFIFPLYWILTGSLKDAITINAQKPQWFPLNPTLDNYVRLFKQPAIQWLLNTIIIAVAAMLLTCIYRGPGRLCPGQKNAFMAARSCSACWCAPWPCPSRSSSSPCCRR